MTIKLLYPLVVCSIVTLFSYGQNKKVSEPVNFRVHAFYYGWYGNPEYDGKYNNWNHPVLPHWRDTTWNNAGHFPGGDDIGANFYPALGCYSSNDPEIISRHMEWMTEAGIGVVAISWWGKNHFTDKSVGKYLDIAQEYGLKITFHIEPIYKTIEEFKAQIDYIAETYYEHPALFKHKGKPLYYIYDSGKVKYPEWHKLLASDGEISIRNTSSDAWFIGHWERERDGGFFLKSGFDGFYTYYASEGFMYGCTSSNWPVLANFARQNNLLFIPCAGPGYIDTRIRPWNTRNTQSRDAGKYYERMFMNAVKVNPDFIGITSFNEWHEGTQIEPAIPKSIPTFTYEDYRQDTDPMFYIKKTKELINNYKK
ncbi:glycoside hydrolase family 99 protein [Draconibacterium sp.]|nr:glycoside hydrolase family 99 protein [Draconibacterium sp.]